MTVQALKDILDKLPADLEVFVHSDDGKNGGPCRSAEMCDKDYHGYPYMQANNYPETKQKYFILRG